MLENGFNFGLGVIGAGVAWNIGTLIFLIIVCVVVYFLGYAYYWYKQKVRKCPKCGSKDYRYFTETSCLSSQRIEKCECRSCRYKWEV